MIFYILYAIWILSEIYFNRAMRSGQGDRKGKDANSLSLIWITVVAAIALAVYVSMKLNLPMGRNDFVMWSGLGLMVIGIIWRSAVVRSLGKYFTVDVTIREGHQLKTDGFYKHLRHPSYSASLLTFLGFAFTLNNWASMAIVVIPVFLSFRHRIRIEEQVLEEQFGEAYKNYKSRTDAMIPMVF
jgi:protein-S-isoprenylcysteine O-methyltransferase Ste14